MAFTAWALTPSLSHRTPPIGVFLAGAMKLAIPLLAAVIGLWWGAFAYRLHGSPPWLDDPTRCAHCGYPKRGLPEPRCPECGRPFERLG